MVNISNQLQLHIDDFYKKILNLDYNATGTILRLISEVERLSHQYPQNTELLILQTRLQIMASQEQRARALAKRVWELGGNISVAMEKLYIDDLINLGLTDMATILIRPRFKQIAENIKIFPLEMIRYALLIGNTDLLRYTAVNNSSNPLCKAIIQFADTYIRCNYTAHFANIAQIVRETVGNIICGYDFNIYTDRGFTDIEIVLYFSNYDFGVNKHITDINNRIDGYFLTIGGKKINNLSFVARQIKDHPKI